MENLSGDINQLLPLATDKPTCSEHTQTIALDPRGTALNIDAVVLIELPLPWPKPVFAHPLLKGLDSLIHTSMGVTRVLACQPHYANKNTSVTVFCKGDAIFDRWVFELDSENSLMELIENLISSKPESVNSKKSTEKNKAILLCTQGSHYISCGSKGTRLAELMEEHDTGVELFKVSHLGGHRFSPTAMTMPDGRMWAGLDSETLSSILEKRIEVKEIAKLCRGWTGAIKGPEQIAEIEVFKQIGWELDNQKRQILTNALDDGWSVEILTENEKWLVDIRKGREVPTITCRSEGGIPFTTANEYIVDSVKKIS